MSQTDLLLITPPFTQVNTPYPATATLKGFLQSKGFGVKQFDLGIACILEIFSSDGLQKLFNLANKDKCSANSNKILQSKKEYLRHIDAVVAFLQGKDSTYALAVNNRILPEAGRFQIQQDLDWHYGINDQQDKAKFLASLFLEDLGDFVAECIDSRFGFSRYAEHIGLDAINYQTIVEELKINSPITDIMCRLLDDKITQTEPKMIGFTIPFPGNLLMTLKSAEFIKQKHPDIFIVLGGGFVNTELRQLSEPRLFELVDYVCLDDGELTLLKLLNYILKGEDSLARTFRREEGRVKYLNNPMEKDFAHSDCGIPDFEDLPLNDYISICETTNPMHNLWSNGRWNKMVLTHGCYWHRCSFCDITLDYIKRFSQADATVLCDRIEAIIKQTGQRGFHFVDEAASPQVLRNLAKEIIRRNISVSWWTNIRFESAFTPELCDLLAASGCVAVSGGLEVASDRLLKKMQKGVTVEQITKVCASFKQAGIMIHAYLMYGFPTQTVQETIDSLEVVRQLFHYDLLQSAFWHRFTMTIHSPIGISPEKFEVEPIPQQENTFTQNGCNHIDKKGCRHEKYSEGLVKALYNYIHDNGVEYDLQEWFDFKIPQTTIPPNYIKGILKKRTKENR